jgi:uncharacterized membrane protein YgcG
MPIVALPQLFVILAHANPERVAATLSVNYPNAYLMVAPGQWLLVAAGKTAKEISDDLGISTGVSGNGMVFTGTGSYFGRGEPGTWEWLKSRLGAPVA